MSNNYLRLFYTYPYFFASLLGLAFVLVGYATAKGQRQAMLLAGLGLVPLAPLAILHEDTYWSPVRLNGGQLGVEDVLFLFQTGAMSWLLAAAITRRKIHFNVAVITMIRRHSLLAGLGVTLVLILFFWGLDIMTSSLLAIVGVALTVLTRQPHLWRLVPAGMLGYSLFYFFSIKICFWIWPDFVTYWNSGNDGLHFFYGVPAGELAFAIVVGATYPVCLGYGLDARFHIEA